MFPLTLVLWVCAGGAIGLLAAFSVQNRRAGWKRPRVTLAETLEELYGDLGLSDQPAEPARQPVNQQSLTPEDAADFSSQLTNLRGALGSAPRTIVTEDAPPQKVQEAELVPVRSR